MKLSIIILCWNDFKVISDCLRSIHDNTKMTEYEIIVSDNGSTDGSIQYIRQNYPNVKVIENGMNLRFAKGNNVGILASRGEYVLILNPDTIIQEGAVDEIVRFADQHPESGAFGCRVLNADGSYQESARPFRTVTGEWITALGLRPLGHLSNWFACDRYLGWQEETAQQVDWISGCFMLVRGELLKQIGGFDEQFFYYFEDMDLCRRIRRAGYAILYHPDATIVHLGGQSTHKRLPPVTFVLDGQVTRYRYIYKYYGREGVRSCRRASLTSSVLRRLGYGVLQIVRPAEHTKNQLALLKILTDWHYRVDPVRLVEAGEEPEMTGRVHGRVLER
jgi:N-acetylglucosaminyl-diphospho-decaprenol L-rhamnosyltransferase